MPTSHSSVAHVMHSAVDSFWGQDPWLVFNRQLSRDAVSLPTEASLDQALEMVQEVEVVNPSVFWLTISRITEMAIKLAGDYADSCEFQAAGDLLVNPRQIDVYQRGHAEKIRKDRHCGLSDQFAAAIGSEHPATWLTRETHLRIKSKALLPHLYDLLSSSGCLASAYLCDVDQRMRRVSDTIAFLSAWQITDHQRLHDRIRQADPMDRELIVANLCCFENRYFVEMGADIEGLILYGEHRSRFLNRLPAICTE